MKHKQQGFSAALIVCIVAVLAVAGLIVWRLMGQTSAPTSNQAGGQEVAAANVTWSFNGTTWNSSGTPPACPDPLTLAAPADISMASGALYPGQIRGGNYKPHGGLVFRGKQNTDVTVKAPFDGLAVLGSRYIEQGETQYLLFFVNSCGIAYRFDHLLTLAPAMQKLADTLPAPQVDNSMTAKFQTPVAVVKGDTIATAVGFTKGPNVSFDLGVYDLREPNQASKDAAYAQKHASEKEQAFYGVCWFDWLDSKDSAAIKALPGADATMGKTSDYCK